MHYIHIMEYYSTKWSNQILICAYSMDEPWKYYINWNKSDTKDKYYIIPPMWKM
jgi:hypothetical protein